MGSNALRWLTAIALLLSSARALGKTGGQAAGFESHWQDGRAEVSGYRYTVTRYGQSRNGVAVLIYVTEPFSESKRVKVDRPDANPRDTFEALKLNIVRDFQTGIYDYNTMTSLFVRSRDFSPVKIAFSAMEWCGSVYEEMLYARHHVASRVSSYFEGESGLNRLPLKAGGISDEELLVRLRDLRQPWLRPGERRRVWLLPSPFYRRLAHQPLAWTEAQVERRRGSEPVQVPAGRFETVVYRVSCLDGREGTFWIERDHPHRVIRWAWEAGAKLKGRRAGRAAEGLDSGAMTGSARIAYWKLNQPGGERALEELGLPPGAAAALGGVRARAR